MLAAPRVLWAPEVIPSLPQLTLSLPLHHEVVFINDKPSGVFFVGYSCNTDYCIILFKSVCSPFTPLFFALPWLNNQKKVTFLRSDFHACSMLGRHFRFPRTFLVTHPSTQETTNTLYYYVLMLSWHWYDILRSVEYFYNKCNIF